MYLLYLYLHFQMETYSFATQILTMSQDMKKPKNKDNYEDSDFARLSESQWQHRLDGGRVQECCRGINEYETELFKMV